MKTIKELTPLSIGLGVIIGVVMTAANVYLGLYAGMTVSASIPAAVIAMGVLVGVLRTRNIFEANIVQTMASAGESLAAGVIFTLPALVLIGAWQGFDFWATTTIAIAGGLLGVIFMIPLRRALIVEHKELTYPEGVACATVLNSAGGEGTKGLSIILKGLGLGALFKFCSAGLKVLTGSVEAAFKVGSSTIFMGLDASPALLAIGYIVRLEVAALVFIGGTIGWFIGIPLLSTPAGMEDASALDIAWTLWSTQIRFVGVGAMIVGGVWSIISVRRGIVAGVQGLGALVKTTDGNDEVSRKERDIPLWSMGVVLLLALLTMGAIYRQFVGSTGLGIATAIIMFIASFLFVAVSSYVVGLVGTSNNPVSGMTISALLTTAVFFLVIGMEGNNAILATLGVAAVVCCAACTAGDCSQDLKTGHLIGATPRSQQIAQIIGVAIPALVIAPVLTLLHTAYGIGDGLKAPQATLFASITKALFGQGELPYHMVAIGAVLGVVILFADGYLKKKGTRFRLHLMPLAVGIYLPVTLAVPMFIGGLMRYALDKKHAGRAESEDAGVLVSSGLIAGEAIMGVIVAIFLYLNIGIGIEGISKLIVEMLSLAAFAGVCLYLWKTADKSING